MNIRIGFVLKLPGHEPAVRLGQFDGLVDHAYRALGGRRYDHFRAEKTHQLAPLDAEWLCHGDHKRMSLGRANHRKANSRIAACGLNDRLARLEFSRFFSGLDHPKRQSILHRTKRVEGFDLDEEIYSGRRKAIDAHDGRVANGLDNALENPSHAAPPNVASPSTRHIARRCRKLSRLPLLGNLTALAAFPNTLPRFECFRSTYGFVARSSLLRHWIQLIQRPG